MTDAQARRQLSIPARLAYLLENFKIENRLAVFMKRGGSAYGAVVLCRRTRDSRPTRRIF